MGKYTYDPNEKDYEKKIQQAVSAGDMEGAAELEGYRNRKIQDLGLGDKPTYRYTTNPEVQNKYESSKTDVYVPDSNIGNPSDFQYDVAKPTYQSPYSGQIDTLLNEILNREDFSYNYENDPLYKQFAETYTREGNRAMNDTLAASAANTGGLASSYSVGAANQANNYFMSQLSDKIPELEQLAYAKYMDDYAMQTNNLGLLQGQDDRMYGRNRDAVGDWYNDRDFAYGQNMDQINRDITVDQNNYNRFVDQRDWSYGVGRDALEDQRYDEELEYNRGQDELANAVEQSNLLGYVPEKYADLLGVKAGTSTSDAYFRQIEADIAQQNANTNSSQETRMQTESNQAAAWNRFESSGVLSAKDAEILGFPPSAVGMPYPGKETASGGSETTAKTGTAAPNPMRDFLDIVNSGAKKDVSTMPVTKGKTYGSDVNRYMPSSTQANSPYADQKDYVNEVYGSNGESDGIVIDGKGYTWEEIGAGVDSKEILEVKTADGRIQYIKNTKGSNNPNPWGWK